MKKTFQILDFGWTCENLAIFMTFAISWWRHCNIVIGQNFLSVKTCDIAMMSCSDLYVLKISPGVRILVIWKHRITMTIKKKKERKCIQSTTSFVQIVGCNTCCLVGRELIEPKTIVCVYLPLMTGIMHKFWIKRSCRTHNYHSNRYSCM